MMLCGIDASVMKVLELTRLDGFFRIAMDREAALHALGK